MSASKFKRGDSVTARTSGNPDYTPGKYVRRHDSAKGEWHEIKPTDSSLPNFKARPAHVEPA